jgi:16S rRNA (uracil1498-N3)-methyltransferase
MRKALKRKRGCYRQNRQTPKFPTWGRHGFTSGNSSVKGRQIGSANPIPYTLIAHFYDSCLKLTTRRICQQRGDPSRKTLASVDHWARSLRREEHQMPKCDARHPRLFVDVPLSAGIGIALDRDQTNYVGNVLRLAAGDMVLLFNGREGEWLAALAGRKRPDRADIVNQIRLQDRLPAVDYIFAPLKHARLDYMVQKAVEMGAGSLQPVTTQRTQMTRVNTERMRANVIEAAEQCGILSLAEVHQPLPLGRWLGQRDAGDLLVFCDEEAPHSDPKAALASAGAIQSRINVLIGPEGGFSEDERNALLRQPKVVRLSLGPRILRADTAAVSALTLVQAVLGDWCKS